jgi:hypothetical protein
MHAIKTSDSTKPVGMDKKNVRKEKKTLKTNDRVIRIAL